MTKIFEGKKVAVLLGGLSAERDVSLKTGAAVLKGLQAKGYDAVGIDAGRDLPARLTDEGVEVAFIALHGKYGEDGAVQGLLEIMGIPYTGSSVTASAAAMNKAIAKDVFVAAGLPTPEAACVTSVDAGLAAMTRGNQYVVKPVTTGSTIGVHVVTPDEPDEARTALADAFTYDADVLVEQFIEGKEITVSVVGGQALPSIEIIPPEGFYDYDAKYTYAKGKTQYVIPAGVSDPCRLKLESITLDAWKALGCEGFGRADFMVDADENAWLLEVNTVPGMTETSLVPKAAAHVGIEFNDLVEQILNTARLKLTVGK